MAKEKKNFDLKEYPFSTEEIPRLNIDNPETEKRIAAGVKLYVLLMQIIFELSFIYCTFTFAYKSHIEFKMIF